LYLHNDRATGRQRFAPRFEIGSGCAADHGAGISMERLAADHKSHWKSRRKLLVMLNRSSRRPVMLDEYARDGHPFPKNPLPRSTGEPQKGSEHLAHARPYSCGVHGGSSRCKCRQGVTLLQRATPVNVFRHARRYTIRHACALARRAGVSIRTLPLGQFAPELRARDSVVQVDNGERIELPFGISDDLAEAGEKIFDAVSDPRAGQNSGKALQ